MSYDTYESSVESGQPVELYDFILDGKLFFPPDDEQTSTYKYTTGPESVTLIGLGTYEPTAISREKLQASKEDPNGDRFSIEIPASLPISANYVKSIPGKRVQVILRRYHADDPDLQVKTVFRGSIQQVSFSDDRTRLRLDVVNLMSALSRQIPRFTYQGPCNHMLYDAGCTIDPEDTDWKKDLTITAVDGLDITTPGAGDFGADFFKGGFVEWDGDYRMIVTQDDDVLTLNLPFFTSPLGEEVICRAGCLHTVDACDTKFVNIENFSGFPFVPLKNPFETGIG